MMRHLAVWILGVVAVTATAARAADIPVVSKKLVLGTKFRHFISQESVSYTAHDPAVTKGAGVDPADISAQLFVAYGTWYGKGQWSAPTGTDRWLRNDARGAMYLDPEAGMVRRVRKVVIAPGRLLKLTGTTLGDAAEDIDPTRVGNPYGSVYTAFCVTNGAEESCHCSQFPSCTWAISGDGNSGKLRCKGGVGDPSCRAKCRDLVDLGATVRDGCSGLEWEKKETSFGTGVDAANPHDVDNEYTWAGQCSLDASALCQPTAAAAALCAAQTGGALGCAECGVGQGACDVTLDGAVTTVWDWLAGLNATAFGGHTDWHVPTGGSGVTESGAGIPSELASLADHVCSFLWCTGTTLGPVALRQHWTATSSALDARLALGTFFTGGPSVDLSGGPSVNWKTSAVAVRAVRSAP